MLTPVTRIAARTTVPRNILKSTAQRRFASSKVPADRRRSWKSFAARWGLAIGGVYYYNTSPYFQGKVHEAYDPRNLPITSIEDENASSPSLEELAASRRARLATASAGASDARSATTLESATAATPTVSSPSASTTSDQAPSDPNALEEEASQQGAFNEETGEINWDCPCLGGMAHGPCGPEFREAFSCFVFSKEEPKGMECIDKFKGMQNCFREHPDIYGAELMDDDEPEDDAAGALDGVEGSPPGGAIAGPSGEVAPAPYSGADVERGLPQEGRTAVPSSSPLGLGGDAKTESDLAPRDKVASSPKKTEK